MLEEEDPGIPLLDLLDAEEAKSERIDDILAKFDEMGVHLAEADAKIEVEARTDEESEEGENEIVDARIVFTTTGCRPLSVACLIGKTLEYARFDARPTAHGNMPRKKSKLAVLADSSFRHSPALGWKRGVFC